MVRAVGDLNLESRWLWCVAHRLHLTVTKALGFWIKKSGDESICIDEADSTDDHEEEMLDCDSLQSLDGMEISDECDMDESEMEELIENSNNECEFMDLNDDEIIDNWTEHVTESHVDIAPDQDIINILINKCRGLISIRKRSTIITSYFNAERKKLRIKKNLCQDVKSRWNSTFCMIDSFLVLREVIERLLNSKHHLHLESKTITKLAELELTSDDWTILSQLHFVLQPSFHATKVMLGRQYPSFGFAFYVLMRLKGFLQDHPKKENSIAKRLKQLLLTKLLFYFESDKEQLYLLKVSGL
ncbi:unnamed protein product [Didymodactylos carnosus]|uniref:Transposase n=1 Tax=Didymodactylos carnosus TaxID=1234261 RepID=A0A814UTN3_9BILA|nr:unnamed protein product [Didymodactylos carnosus]CAF1178714.1 unnamed protein product [Didymodactylos carnosus]CAF3621551.1 unnamed protein product [Didymodactylos carnosus]CAF3942912.1 unnamed protein product [Didymodactylos carnosus]